MIVEKIKYSMSSTLVDHLLCKRFKEISDPAKAVLSYVRFNRERRQYDLDELLACVADMTGFKITSKDRKSKLKKELVSLNLLAEDKAGILFNPLVVNYSQNSMKRIVINYYKNTRPNWQPRLSVILDRQAEEWGLLPITSGKGLYWYEEEEFE